MAHNIIILAYSLSSHKVTFGANRLLFPVIKHYKTNDNATERQTGKVGSYPLNIAKLLAGKEADISLRCEGRRVNI